MAKNLDLEIIVEGVETSEQQALSTRWGCTGFQGCLPGKPVSIEQFKPYGFMTNQIDPKSVESKENPQAS